MFHSHIKVKPIYTIILVCLLNTFTLGASAKYYRVYEEPDDVSIQFSGWDLPNKTEDFLTGTLTIFVKETLPKLVLTFPLNPVISFEQHRIIIDPENKQQAQLNIKIDFDDFLNHQSTTLDFVVDDFETREPIDSMTKSLLQIPLMNLKVLFPDLNYPFMYDEPVVLRDIYLQSSINNYKANKLLPMLSGSYYQDDFLKVKMKIIGINSTKFKIQSLVYSSSWGDLEGNTSKNKRAQQKLNESILHLAPSPSNELDSFEINFDVELFGKEFSQTFTGHFAEEKLEKDYLVSLKAVKGNHFFMNKLVEREVSSHTVEFTKESALKGLTLTLHTDELPDIKSIHAETTILPPGLTPLTPIFKIEDRKNILGQRIGSKTLHSQGLTEIIYQIDLPPVLQQLDHKQFKIYGLSNRHLQHSGGCIVQHKEGSFRWVELSPFIVITEAGELILAEYSFDGAEAFVIGYEKPERVFLLP